MHTATASKQSEGWDINLKRNAFTFQKKLLCYFMFFTAVIFTVLWLLQTVFLQRFYDGMIIRNTEAAAGEIAAGSGERGGGSGCVGNGPGGTCRGGCSGINFGDRCG